MIINEKVHDGAFLINEQASYLSRDNGILASGQKLAAGTVVIRAYGKWSAFDSNTDHPVGVLYANTDATSADRKAVIITRKAKVDASQLIWPTGFTTQQLNNARELMLESGFELRRCSVNQNSGGP